MNDGGVQQEASSPAENPFVPERLLIRRNLDRLGRKRPLDTNLILYGPRGNGKTALLAWAVGQAKARGIRSIRLAASQSYAKEVLLNDLAVLPTWLRESFRKLGSASAFGPVSSYAIP